MKVNRKKWPMHIFAVTALILLAGLGGWIAQWSGRNMDTAMRERLLQQAVRIAQTLDPEQIKTLSFTEADRSNPVFQRIRAQMVAYGQILWQRGIYSMALRDGNIYFGPENYAENDPMSSPPGTVYKQPDSDSFKVFHTGKPVTLGPQTDEYGTFVSALAPVLDPRDGAVLMVVGLDIQADDWQARINTARQGPVLSTVILLTILIAGSMSICWRDRLAIRRERFKHLETVWIGVCGLVLTIAIAMLAREIERREQDWIFNQEADSQIHEISAMFHQIQNDIATLVHVYENRLYFDDSLFNVMAAPMVNAVPVQAYAWVPVTQAIQKDAVEIAAQRAGTNHFVIWERDAQGEPVPVASRAEYYPVYAIEPRNGHEDLFGFDLGSEPQWRAMIEQAARTGLVAAIQPMSSPHAVVHPQDLLIAQPAFSSETPSQQPRDGNGSDQHLHGFVLSIIHPQAILDSVLKHYLYKNLFVVVSLLDLQPESKPALLATYPSPSVDDPSVTQSFISQQIYPLFIFGRTWVMVCHPSPLFYITHSLWEEWLVGITGLIITITLTAFIGFLRERRATFRQLLQERTAALQSSEEKYRNIYENIQDTYLETAIDGTILEVSSQITKLSKGQYQREDLIGKNIIDLSVYPEARAKLLQNLQEQGSVEDWEVSYRNRDGSLMPCTISSTIQYDEKKQQKKIISTLRDITERKQVERRIQVLSRAVEQSPVSIVITDPAGSIEYANPKFMEVTGYTMEEAVGQNPRVLNSGQQPKEFYQELWNTISSGHDWHGEFCNKKKNGDIYWESASISPIRDIQGQVISFVAIKEDITEKKQSEVDLLQAKQAAESANIAKSQFLANISHEIRTPMNGIIGMTGLLLDTDLSEVQRRYADIVRSSGENLLSLINDILDFSKIDSDKLELDILDFDLRVMLEDTVETLVMRAYEKGLEFTFYAASNIYPFLRGDPGRLRQMLVHLGGNAIKFTAHGKVTMNITLLSETSRQTTVQFEVCDTGIGIAEDKMNLLFTAFQQVDASTTRQFGGAGLGLIICKRLAEKMNGEIGVRSQVGQGSTFWFTAVFDKQPTQERHDPALMANLQGIRMLAVDDKATNRLVIAEQLASYGVRHEETESAVKALALLREAQAMSDPFRVVVTDMQMSDMDGEALGRAIKADPNLRDTVLVMMTSLGSRGDAKRLANIGFAAYLTKPVNQIQLHDCLTTVLGKTTTSRAVQTTLVTRHTLSEAHRRPCRILLVEDSLINQKVALKLLEKLGCHADVVVNGQAAIHALETQPYDLVFMDVEMPEMDGFEATRRIRTGQTRISDPTIPIIAMTGHTGIGSRNRCLEAGMNAYVGKPISLNALLQALSPWCPVHRIEPTRSSASKLLAVHIDQPLEVPGLDTTSGLLRLAGDQSLYRRLLGRFVETQAGATLAIREALNQNDLTLAKRLTHNMKGIAGNLGATGVETATQALEDALNQGQTQLLNPLLTDFERQINELIRCLRGQPTVIPESSTVAAIPPSDDAASSADLLAALDRLIPLLKMRKPKKCAEAIQALQELSWPTVCWDDLEQLVRQVRQYQFMESLILIESLRQKLQSGEHAS